jgi:hypothetical protein
MGNRSTPQLQEQVAQQSQQLAQLAQQNQQRKKNSIVEFLNQHCESIDEIICVLEQLHLDNFHDS